MKSCISLMPVSSLVWLERRRQIFYWIRLWSLCALSLTATSVILLTQDRKLRHQLALAKNKVLDVRAAFDELHQLSTELVAIRESVQASRSLEQRDLPLQLMLVISQVCQNMPDYVQLKSLKFQEVRGIKTDDQTKVANNKKQPETYQQIVLTGVASPDSCGLLVSLLKESSAFGDVQLVSSQTVAEQSGGRVSFQIQCNH